MKHQAPTDRDPLALDQYERVMAHHKDMLAEAERMRLEKQIPVSGKSKRSLFKTLLSEIGGELISLGEWLKAQGSIKPAQEDFALQHQEDL